MTAASTNPTRVLTFEWPTPLKPPPRWLAELRENEPVSRVTTQTGDVIFLVTRHEDVQRVLSDPVFSRAHAERPGAPRTIPSRPAPSDVILSLDPPEHTRLRKVAAKAFTPRRIEAMRGGIEQTVDRLLDRLAADGPPAELVEELCAPLPITVICELLGVPYADRADFRAWSSQLLSAEAHTAEERAQARNELYGYLTRLVAAKRAAPGTDLMSALVADRDERDRLTESELVNLGITLLVAGHETTLNQLGIDIYVLLSRPDGYAALCADPELVPGAVEELMRLHPVSDGSFVRIATQDVEIAGVHIPAGSGVITGRVAANRDPRVYPDAETMDFRRTDNRHLTFGHGPHFCLGAALARLEMQVALTGLVRRFPSLRLAVEPDEVPWRSGYLVWGPLELPVTW